MQVQSHNSYGIDLMTILYNIESLTFLDSNLARLTERVWLWQNGTCFNFLLRLKPK